MDPKDPGPATDVRAELDHLVSIASVLLKDTERRENLDIAESRADDLVSQALRCRRAVIMLRPK
jgi:hypothetical protein